MSRIRVLISIIEILKNATAYLGKIPHAQRKKIKEVLLVATHPLLKEAFSVASHLTNEERVTLFTLSKNLNYILEIGSYIGASTCCFGAALKTTGSGKVICIDTWKNDAMTEGNRDTWLEFLHNTASYQDHIVPIRGFSTDVVADVDSCVTSLDLLFIDGDHSYDGVKADWESYKHFLQPGSIVVFHDSGWAEGVKRVIEEDVTSRVQSSDCLPNMWWGVIK